MNKYINSFRYLLRYYNLPRQIQQKIANIGVIFENGIAITARNNKGLDVFDIYNTDKRDDKFQYSVLEALFIYCLEL